MVISEQKEAYCWSVGEFCWQTLLQMSWKARLCRDTRSSSSLTEKYSFFWSCAASSICFDSFCSRAWHRICETICTDCDQHVERYKLRNITEIIPSLPTRASWFSCCSWWVWLSCWTALPRQRSSRSCTLVFTVARRPSSSVALCECWADRPMCSWTSSLQTRIGKVQYSWCYSIYIHTHIFPFCPI